LLAVCMNGGAAGLAVKIRTAARRNRKPPSFKIAPQPKH
jgi:hypothetical protein